MNIPYLFRIFLHIPHFYRILVNKVISFILITYIHINCTHKNLIFEDKSNYTFKEYPFTSFTKVLSYCIITFFI